jgi:thioesterase domain-containing protein/acyl carrier protein
MAYSMTNSASLKNGVYKPSEDEVFVFPATLQQQGFWYVDQVEPGNPAYNIAVRFRLQGPLQFDALQRALNEIVRRHDTLRTVFQSVRGLPVQVVAPSLTISVAVTDLRNVLAADRQARSDTLAAEEARRRFDLAAGPLIRTSLLRLDDLDHVLLVTIHHIVSDGWSIGVFTNELGALYNSYCRGIDSGLPELPLQYGDFAVWQKHWLERGTFEDQLSYWARQLSNLPLLEITTDLPRPAIWSSNGYIESILLPKELTEGIQKLSNLEGLTFFMVALAALKVLIHHHSRQTDIFVGTLVAGRSRVELEPRIGPFINTLVLRTDLSNDPPFRELLSRVRETVLQALANQEAPFERVVEAIQPKRDLSRHPVFQINFIFQRDFVRPLDASGLTLTAIPSKSPGSMYDLNFFMVERADGWRASCEYNTDLYDGATIKGLLRRFEALLTGICINPDRLISELALLTVEERLQLLEPNWRNRAGAAPNRLSGHQLRVPPRNETEERLAKLWERVLGAKDISITADFFDTGGHSLLAARLLAQIERTFGRTMSLALFLQSPTIEHISAFLGNEKEEARREQIVAIQREGSSAPLYLVDAGPLFRPLARRLGLDQPVFGMLLPGLADLPTRFTVGDLAANLIRALRDVQPHGPYYLGGWSHAGVIAYEIAQQLRSQGEVVALVALFDTCSPQYLQRFEGLQALPVRLFFLAEKLLYHFGNLRLLKPAEAMTYARERIRTILLGWKLRLWELWYRDMQLPAAEHMKYSSQFQYLAVKRYQPMPSAAPLVLFRSQVLQTGRFRDPLLGWGEVARNGLVLHELPGDHEAMFIEPGVELLAARLAECLAQTEKAPTVRGVDDVTEGSISGWKN